MNNKYKYVMLEYIDTFYKHKGEVSFQLEEIRRLISIDTIRKTGNIIDEFIKNGTKNIKLPKSYFSKEFFKKILIRNIELCVEIKNKSEFIEFINSK
jgi:hypothetical protein